MDINVDAATSSYHQDQPDITAVQPPSNGDIPAAPSDGAKVESMEQLKQWFRDCFDGIGCFQGEAELHLKPNAKPSSMHLVDAPYILEIKLNLSSTRWGN